MKLELYVSKGYQHLTFDNEYNVLVTPTIQMICINNFNLFKSFPSHIPHGSEFKWVPVNDGSLFHAFIALFADVRLGLESAGANWIKTQHSFNFS